MKDVSIGRFKFIIWFVVFMCFIATGLSFLDRQVLSISIIEIREQLHIGNTDYGIINTSFLIGYAIMFTLGGILIDKFGSKLGLGVSVALWSVATLLHGFADNVLHFAILRFILGLGEGGAFPGVIKAVVEWVPKKNQALANGIAIGGSAFGAVVAPPLTVMLMDSVGWRGVFFIVGVIGMVWSVCWLLIPHVSKYKKQVGDTIAVAVTPSADQHLKLIGLLKIKEVWVFIVVRFLLDPIFYFYMFWIPKFLNETKGVSLEVIGNLFWIPYLALGISNVFGGFLSDRILEKTGKVNFSRKLIMGIAALLTIAAIFVQNTSSVNIIIILLSIAFFAHGLWITNYITSISDIFGRSASSTIVGFSGSAGAISSLIINPFMGVLIARFSYDSLWIYAGIMYPLAFLIFTVFIPRIKAIDSNHLNIENSKHG
ncbi:MAG: MFS transporter [Bacteroidia bacterium 44-10]|nr:MAG: MFS transporter [Bacteroidia bacterium 44-10]